MSQRLVGCKCTTQVAASSAGVPRCNPARTTGLFLVRRERMCTHRLISSSRPARHTIDRMVEPQTMHPSCNIRCPSTPVLCFNSCPLHDTKRRHTECSCRRTDDGVQLAHACGLREVRGEAV